jgi:hypothetical protein
MTAIGEGIYKEGKIELLGPLAGVREGRVRVIVVDAEPAKPPPRFLSFGKYPGPPQSTLEDFHAAQWHGEEEFDDRHGQ